MDGFAFRILSASVCARSLLLPGTWILLTDGPTRPIPRLTVLGQAPTFPHPEPPLLFPVIPGVATPGVGHQ
jgi:hypothetical protein